MISLLTSVEVAKILSCSPKTVYARANSGQIPSYKMGGSVRFKPSDIEAYIEGSRRENKPARAITTKSVKNIDRIVRNAIDSVKGSNV